jgi:lysine 2,3-aminomutase
LCVEKWNCCINPQPTTGTFAMNERWHESQRDGIRSIRDAERFPLSVEEREAAEQTSGEYLFRAPKYYLDLIDWSDPEDPIRRQVIPDVRELIWDPNEHIDPIGDRAFSPVPRLTHRYPDRVLLFPTYHCAVYCRHCFRKESLAEDGFKREELEPALGYIADHSQVCEVILTGGDPLQISDSNLAYLRDRLAAIPHVRMIRLHTRIPVVLPSRITPQLVAAISGRQMVCVVTHFNHPREITEEAAAACRRLREAGFMMLNQTVLLKGVNDNPETLRTLLRELTYTLGVKPYYLHHCDLTRGMTHFRTTIDSGLALMRQLRGYQSGVTIPTYVLDIPGGAGKIPLGPSYVERRSDSEWSCLTYDGQEKQYAEVVATEQRCEGVNQSS